MFSHLLSKLPASRIADWRLGVTVCIAAFADSGNSIVTATDRKVAFRSSSADKAVFKGNAFAGSYMLLVAGNDAARAENVISKSWGRVLADIEDNPEEKHIKDPDYLAEILHQECNQERDRIIEASVLKKRGYTWKLFREQGKGLCTDAVYYDLESEIADVDLSLDLLLAGYDHNKTPHLRFLNWKTPPENYDSLGFFAIGRGAHAAISSLAHAVEYLSFTRHNILGDVLYHTLAAKFMAESAHDVGRDTFAVVIKPDSRLLSTHVLGGDEYIRDVWTKKGAPRLPRGIGEAIQHIIGTPEEFLTLEGLTKVEKYLPKARARIKSRFNK
jgi:hypothetical protein